LNQTKAERDFTAVLYELIRLVVSELHNVHSFLDLWVEIKVECQSAWQLDVENPNTSGVCSAVLVVVILIDGHGHAYQHYELCARDNDGVLEVKALL
jgi:hypothetical protein